MVVSVISKKLKRTNFVPNHYRATSIKVFAKYFFPALKWHKIEAEMIVFQRGIFIAHIFFRLLPLLHLSAMMMMTTTTKISVISWTLKTMLPLLQLCQRTEFWYLLCCWEMTNSKKFAFTLQIFHLKNRNSTSMQSIVWYSNTWSCLSLGASFKRRFSVSSISSAGHPSAKPQWTLSALTCSIKIHSQKMPYITQAPSGFRHWKKLLPYQWLS